MYEFGVFDGDETQSPLTEDEAHKMLESLDNEDAYVVQRFTTPWVRSYNREDLADVLCKNCKDPIFKDEESGAVLHSLSGSMHCKRTLATFEKTREEEEEDGQPRARD